MGAWIVNGVRVRASELRAEVAAIRQEFEESCGPSLSLEERLAMPGLARERLFDRIVLRVEAARLGMIPTEQETRQAAAALAPRSDGVSGCRADLAAPSDLWELSQRLGVERLMEWCFSRVARPRSSEVRAFYQNNRELFRTPPLAHVWHLTKNFREPETDEAGRQAAVERMRHRLINGDDFATVAKEESDCPEHDGNLGYFARGTMVEEFDAVAFTAPVGKITPVFRTRFGYHVAIVKDRKAEGIRRLEEVAAEIEHRLLRVAGDAACGALLGSLRTAAVIEEVREERATV